MVELLCPPAVLAGLTEENVVKGLPVLRFTCIGRYGSGHGMLQLPMAPAASLARSVLIHEAHACTVYLPKPPPETTLRRRSVAEPC